MSVHLFTSLFLTISHSHCWQFMKCIEPDDKHRLPNSMCEGKKESGLYRLQTVIQYSRRYRKLYIIYTNIDR